jgi:hypothetical protein
MSYQFEKNKLYNILGERLVSLLKMHKCYVAGGTITSLFCNREINDVDIYFRSKESLVQFLCDVWESRKYILSHTKKATLLNYDDLDIQLVHFNYYPSPGDIFKTFDFTACMGAFDFDTEEFLLHEDFLKHNSQRILVFNSKTAFPIVSLLRVDKYKQKGYAISKPEFIRIALTCMNLTIETYEELKEQLGGMYGINYDKIFNDATGTLNLEDAIDAIANLSVSDSYFTMPVSAPVEDLEIIVESIMEYKKQFVEIGSKKYKIKINGCLHALDRHTDTDTWEQIDTDEYFKTKRFYKFVKKESDDVFSSFYSHSFKYHRGQIADPLNSTGLYFNELREISQSSYAGHDSAVLIEVAAKKEDFVRKSSPSIILNKCLVVREVPKQEYAGLLRPNQL